MHQQTSDHHFRIKHQRVSLPVHFRTEYKNQQEVIWSQTSAFRLDGGRINRAPSADTDHIHNKTTALAWLDYSLPQYLSSLPNPSHIRTLQQTSRLWLIQAYQLSAHIICCHWNTTGCCCTQPHVEQILILLDYKLLTFQKRSPINQQIDLFILCVFISFNFWKREQHKHLG